MQRKLWFVIRDFLGVSTHCRGGPAVLDRLVLVDWSLTSMANTTLTAPARSVV